MNPFTQNSIQPSRRDFFKKSSLAAIGLAGGGGVAMAENATVKKLPRSGKAKNIIFLVSDGMSQGTLSMADQLIQMRDDRRSHWMNMYREYPVQRGLMDMAAADALVTDSAAASSSWGCGTRVPNGRVNVDGDGRPHEPILQIAKRNGLRTGLVTTTTVTHATPAGFAANGPTRNDQDRFAKQYHERGYDVILGGGKNFFSPKSRGDDLDLLAAFTKDGYQLIHDRDSLLALENGGKKLLGLFQNHSLPYEIDRLNDSSLLKSVPSLAEMSIAALKALSASGDGFIVQIEAARVDHAAHVNDISGLLFDQIAFDDAVEAALQFYEQNPDTMVIVTTDHGNANPGLNYGGGMGENNLGRVLNFKGSTNNLQRLFRRNAREGIDEIRESIRAVTDFGISKEHAQMIVDYRKGNWKAPYSQMNNPTGVLGQILANYTNIGWTGNSHTGDYVELSAVGPGSEMIQPFNLNTDMFTLMCKALDLKVD